MIATILDTITLEAAIIGGISSFEFAENNYSCDCNRSIPFNMCNFGNEYCEGCKRFLVINAVFENDDYVYSLKELNDGYPQELLAKHGVN